MEKYNLNTEQKAVAEPSVAYSTESLPNIQCGNGTQPCIFTDEEFDKEIELAEASGYVTNEETQTFFAQWGFTI